MHYIEVPAFGGPEMLTLREQKQAAPQAGEAVIEVKAVGVNFADVMARAGRYPLVRSAPFRPGYELAGIVTRHGPGESGLKIGQRVMALLPNGGYTSEAVLKENEVIPLPDQVSFGGGTALLIQGLTAYLLLEAGHFQAGQNVMVSAAAGGLGSLAIQIARLKGAGLVIGLASPDKHERVRALGAAAAVNYRQPGWATEVLSHTSGQGVHVYLDASGDVNSEAFEALSAKAYWLVYGSQAGSGEGVSAARLWAMMGKNVALRPYSVFGDVAEFRRVLTELLGWAAQGQLQIEVTEFPLAQAAQAHRAIENRQTTGKVVLVP